MHLCLYLPSDTVSFSSPIIRYHKKKAVLPEARGLPSTRSADSRGNLLSVSVSHAPTLCRHRGTEHSRSSHSRSGRDAKTLWNCITASHANGEYTSIYEKHHQIVHNIFLSSILFITHSLVYFCY